MWLCTLIGLPGDMESDYEHNSSSHPLGVPSHDQPAQPRILPEVEGLTGPGSPEIVDLVVGEKGKGELLDHSIYATGQPKFLSHGSTPNRCIQSLTDGKGSDFYGNLIIYGKSKVASSTVCLDLDTNDLTLALDSLIEYQKRIIPGMGPLLGPKSQQKVTGVKIERSDDLGHDGMPLWDFKEVQVPMEHPIFSSGSKMALEAADRTV